MQVTIGFDNLRVNAIIGVLEEERHCEQEILVDLRASVDFSLGALSDSIKDAVDYTRLAGVCEEVACEGKFQLLESLAVGIATELVDSFPIGEVWLKIKKPAAIESADYAFVELRKVKDR